MLVFCKIPSLFTSYGTRTEPSDNIWSGKGMYQKTIPWLDRSSEGLLWLVAKTGVCNLSLLHPVKQNLYCKGPYSQYNWRFYDSWQHVLDLAETSHPSPGWFIPADWSCCVATQNNATPSSRSSLYSSPAVSRCKSNWIWIFRNKKYEKNFGVKGCKTFFLKKCTTNEFVHVIVYKMATEV